MKFLNCSFLYVLMILFASITIASCGDENETPLSEGTDNPRPSSEEIISNIFAGLSSLVEKGQQPDMENVMAYLKQHWGEYKLEERDSILYVSLEDSLTLQLDIYGSSVVGESNWELDTLSLAHSLDSIANALGRSISDSIMTINTDSVFSEEDLEIAKSRVVGNTFFTRVASSKENTILVNNNILVWAPWYETESEYERSRIYKTINNLANTTNKRRPQYLYLSPLHCNGPRLADLNSMSLFKDYDIVFIDCHGTKNGEIVMPITAETKKLKEYRRNRCGIWDINRKKWVEGVVLSEESMARYLPKKLDHTILFTAMCHAYADSALFYKIAKDRGVADFMGATNTVTIETPLRHFEEFAKTFLTGGVSTTTAFKVSPYKDVYVDSDGGKKIASGYYLRMPVLSNVFYSFARPLPYNKQTNALRGRMPMPQNLISQQRARNCNTQTRSITPDLGSLPQSGFYLKDLKRGKSKMIPLNEKNVTSYQLFPCGDLMADVEYEVKLDNLEPGDYVYCTYLWNGETLIVSKTAQRFSIEDENAEAYAVMSYDNQIITYYYDGKKKERIGLIYNVPARFSSTKTVLFDASFANYKPTSTAGWFDFMENLTSIQNIEYLNTENVTDMHEMFSWCTSLTSLDLSSFNTANVINMEKMFYNCESLKSLNLRSFNTTKVTDMGAMFEACSSLTSLDLSCFNTANVTDMGAMFEACSSLTSLDLSSFNTANVKKMAGMFNTCSSLTSLDLSSFNTSNVTEMHGMFIRCRSLTNLNLSNFNTQNVTSLAMMFEECSSLTSLDLSSFNTANVTQTFYLFTNCSSLKTVYARNWEINKIETSGHEFLGCENLVGGKGTKIGQNLYGYDKNGNPLYYYCSDGVSAAHIDGGKDNPGLFTAK